MARIRKNSLGDLTGKRFGKLVVIGRDADQQKLGLLRWLCKCDCGQTTSQPGTRLTSGNTKSCGCRERKSDQPKRRRPTNLLGQRFGRGVVIERLGANANQKQEWRLLCDCGSTYITNTSQLTSTKTRSCGCLHREIQCQSKYNFTGMVFDASTVTRRLPGSLDGPGMWELQCKCGAIFLKSTDAINKGYGGHCPSCLNARKQAVKLQFCGIDPKHWRGIVRNALLRDLNVDITPHIAFTQFQAQNGICALSGERISLHVVRGHGRTASLDRIESSGHYTRGNIWWLHKDVNFMKKDFSLDALLWWCHRITKHLSGNVTYYKPIIFAKVGPITERIFNKIVETARQRGKPVNIDLDDIIEQIRKQGGRCALTGVPLSFGSTVTKKTASLDRIDSLLPYALNNIQWVHRDINTMKWTLPLSRFVDLAQRISRHNSNITIEAA